MGRKATHFVVYGCQRLATGQTIEQGQPSGGTAVVHVATLPNVQLFWVGLYRAHVLILEPISNISFIFISDTSWIRIHRIWTMYSYQIYGNLESCSNGAAQVGTLSKCYVTATSVGNSQLAPSQGQIILTLVPGTFTFEWLCNICQQVQQLGVYAD